MQNKTRNKMMFSEPCGTVKNSRKPDEKRNGTAPAPSRSRKSPHAPPAYVCKQERIKRANELLRIMSNMKMF